MLLITLQFIFLQCRGKVLSPSSVVPSVSIHSFTAKSDAERGHNEQNNSSTSGSSAVSSAPEDGVSKPECVYAKLDGVSAGVRPPPTVDPTTVQYAGINIRATQVS